MSEEFDVCIACSGKNGHHFLNCLYRDTNIREKDNKMNETNKIEEKTFEEIVRPLIEWMAKNHHPHTTIIVDCVHAELVEGVEVFRTEEYLLD